MRRTREQIRAQLRAEAEAAIEKVLAWQDETPTPNMRQIEDQILQVREQFGQDLAETILQVQDATQLVEAPACPECGQRMQYKDQKSTEAETRIGIIRMNRAYYYCSYCRRGLFPPG
jgi:uncharacterized protein with PIN domain